jgi:hypothetical protein
MKFTTFFDLVRVKGDAEAEAKRIVELDKIEWRELSTPWVLMAFEHFAVMIDRARREDPDVKPEFWIVMRERAWQAIMARVNRKEAD